MWSMLMMVILSVSFDSKNSRIVRAFSSSDQLYHAKSKWLNTNIQLNSFDVRSRKCGSILSRKSSQIYTNYNDEIEDEKSDLSQIEGGLKHLGNDAQKLLKMLQPISSCDVDQVSPTTLAYLGDVVFELFARSRYIWPSRRTTDLQNIVVNSVRGKCQYWILPIIYHHNNFFHFINDCRFYFKIFYV